MRLAEEVATLRQAVRPARDALDAAQKFVDDAAAKQTLLGMAARVERSAEEGGHPADGTWRRQIVVVAPQQAIELLLQREEDLCTKLRRRHTHHAPRQTLNKQEHRLVPGVGVRCVGVWKAWACDRRVKGVGAAAVWGHVHPLDGP